MADSRSCQGRKQPSRYFLEFDMRHDMIRDLAEVMITEEAIANRVRELGADISRDYFGKELILAGVLTGGLFFRGSRVSMRVARGSAPLLPSHVKGIWPRDVLKKVSRGLSRVEAGNPGFPRLVQVTSAGFSRWL